MPRVHDDNLVNKDGGLVQEGFRHVTGETGLALEIENRHAAAEVVDERVPPLRRLLIL